METNGKKLRQALEKENFFLLPGVYDCLSAKMAEKAGFDAVFFSGGAYSLADMGRPDIGFFHTGEVLHALFSILSTIHVPLLMDADNGFGNAIHAADTAKKLEMLGVAGLQIDDQVLPRSIPDRSKECSSWEYVAPKLAAICQSVSDDFVILFRTIANTTDTLDEAISRINRAAELGADYAYVDGIKSYEELCQVSERAKIKLLVNMNERGACAKIPMEKIKALSYRIGLYPVSSVSVAAQAVLSLFETMKKTGSTQSCAESLYSITQLWDDMGLKDQTEKYLPLYKK